MRRWAWAVAFWGVIAVAVWNGFFDVLVNRGEKTYLIGQARAELGVAPRVTMGDIMATTAGDAAAVSTLWALVVLVAGLGWTYIITRRPR